VNGFVKVKASKRSLTCRKPVYDVGVNDSWYITQPVIDGKRVTCPTYSKWASMLKRCYSGKYQEKHPTYKGCTVCDGWLTFSSFEEWFELNNITGFALDKDIIRKGNKVYSPDMCLFVPQCVNNLLNDHAAKRGDHPIGVSLKKDTGKYQSLISIDGKAKRLGTFITPEDASEAYIKAKNKEIIRKSDQYPKFAKYLLNHLQGN